MTQNKCSLLKPVDNLTGTFFLFSQYAQDLTKELSDPDRYRCLPSKFVAMNLDFTTIIDSEFDNSHSQTEKSAKALGEIFQNYFENSCTFLRSIYGDKWSPEFSRTLLFQTLQKYGFMQINSEVEDTSSTTNGAQSQIYGAITGKSDNIQYIGDINIYTNNDTKDGVGYNEIYCYIPNNAQCTDYQLNAVDTQINLDFDTNYTSNYICGYDNQLSYNGLDWKVKNFIDSEDRITKFYKLGLYSQSGDMHYTLIPECLTNYTSDDTPRVKDEKPLESFDVNTILVLYDIVVKNADDSSSTIYKNIPLGIYFTGCLDDKFKMSNIITKYVNNNQIYNQGTSYGLRICTRMLTNPNSTVKFETTVDGQTNVSELAPVLEKMGETLLAAENILKNDDKMYDLLNAHLSQFKNNMVNVPYVRPLGNKKYWFVNGKNTGAIAQYEYGDPEDVIAETIRRIRELYYTKTEINAKLKELVTKNELTNAISSFATKDYVDNSIANLKRDLLVYLQSL